MKRKSSVIPEKNIRRRRQQVRRLSRLTGWELDPSELGDFLHRVRVFPEPVASWRKKLTRNIIEDRERFPEIPGDPRVEDVRALVDEVTVTLRELATILAVTHGTPDLGNKPDPVDELVYIILSRKTREGAYQETYDLLKKRFPDWDALLRARFGTVERLVHSGGLSEKKTQSLFGALRMIRDRFGHCSMNEARKWSDEDLECFLCTLPEISRKSAYCVMMYAMGRAVFPVDTHVGRVLSRMGVFGALGLDFEGLDHKKLQAILADLVPPVLRYSLHVNLVMHGRKTCRGQRPICERCVVNKLCARYRRERIRVVSKEPRFTFGDFFCGAGGLSLGFVQEGFKPVIAVDSDPVACKTYKLNFPMISVDQVICGDARYLSAKDVRSSVGKRGLDVLTGGPPCQGFSLVGNKSKGAQYRRKNLMDFISRRESKNYLYEVMIGAVLILKPRIVIMENVPGMAASRRGNPSFMDDAAMILGQAGYATAIWKLEASAYGIPQKRRRAFLVASRDGRLPQAPVPEYQDLSAGPIDPDALDPVEMEMAVYDLPQIKADEGFEVVNRRVEVRGEDPRSRYYIDNPSFRVREGTDIVFNHRARYNNDSDLELYALLKPGQNGRDILERYGRKDLMRYRTDVFDDKYARLRPDRPCRTIVSHLARDGNSFVHPYQVRSITVREAARIQSFPDDFIFCGTSSDQWNQVGNAVPPVLARRIARVIYDHLGGSSG